MQSHKILVLLGILRAHLLTRQLMDYIVGLFEKIESTFFEYDSKSALCTMLCWLLYLGSAVTQGASL